MESFEAAAKLSAALANAAPADDARRLAYSRVLAFVGMGHWSQGNLDKAEQTFESAEKVLQLSDAKATPDPELIFQLTSLDNNIGHVLEARGKLDEAEAQYKKMLAHCEQLNSGEMFKATWRAQLGTAHNNLGKVALMRGDLAAAVVEYSADHAIESDLSKRDPKNNDQRENLLLVQAILGRTLALTGDVDAGMRNLQRAVEIAMELTQVDSDQATFQEYVALYSSQLARLRRLSGDLPSAQKLTARALEIFVALTKQDPANTDWQVEFAEVQNEHGAQLRAAGKTASSRAAIQASLSLLSPLALSQPDDRSTLLATVGAKLLLAVVTDDPQAAQHLRDEALAATQGAKSGSGDPRLLALRVEALLELGRKAEAQPALDQLWNNGYRDLALLALLRRENIDYPANAAFAQRLQAAINRNDHP